MSIGPVGRVIERLRGEGIGAVLARGAGVFFLVHVAGVGIGFGVQVLLARVLGADTYGAFVYVHSWTILLLILARAGLGTASLRFVAAFSARRDWPRLRGFLRTTRTVVMVASVTVACGTAAAVLALGPRLSDPVRDTFLVACLTMPPYALLQVSGFALRGLKRVLLSQAPVQVLQPVVLGLLVVAVVVAMPGRLDAPTTMLLQLVSVCAALAVTWVGLRRSVPVEARRASPHSDAKAWMRVAAPLLVYNALYVGMQRTDILLVGSLLGSAEAGIYASAARVAFVITFGLVAVNAWAAPLISDLHARGDREGLQRLVRLAARGIFAMTLPLFAGILLFGRDVLGLFGPEFVRAYTPLVILAGAELLNALAGPVGFLMTMTGRQGLAARILAVHAVLLLALAFLLIPRLGLEGAAIATAVGRGGWNLTMVVAVWRTMRLRATIV